MVDRFNSKKKIFMIIIMKTFWIFKKKKQKKMIVCLCLSEINWLKFSKENYLQVTHDDAIP